MSSLYAPTEVEFKHVSANLVKVRLIGTVMFAVFFTVLAIIFAMAVSKWFWVAALVIPILHIWPAVLIRRQVKATQYALGEKELFYKEGIMFKTLEVIPYGRIQFVDLIEGPILRKYGMASLSINTASASTNVTIPGIPKDEAVELRSYLSERGEAEMAVL
ncbi:PH domain-containing protein [Gleimia sp. 6138-11-ORH1]|uniref:PH domain-containing protein n=1 Tax=Gleimia sp. 6138-11-ORH1 TaxID=2973937 RepID=UPI0021689390|nr:PH domain-containing protein [Gleimia sp. 6138-11-ORH1]MCS4484764.1 PH domain-containing protein [Gleimia sp. 6138-11-ORH1]